MRIEKVEKVELLVTLKANKVWRKGSIFNSNDGPIPQDILKEVKAGCRTVKILEPNGVAEKSPIAAPETKNEKTESIETSKVYVNPLDGKLGKLSTSKGSPLRVEMKDQGSGLQSAKEIETKDQSPVPKEKPSVPKPVGSILSDLEDLIKFKGSVAETVRALGVSYPTIVRWRKRESKPQDKMLKLIKKKLRELKNDQSRDDSTSSAGSKGTVNESEL